MCVVHIQVSDDISPTATLSRELAPLKAIKDAYPKYLTARIRHPDYDSEEIYIIDIVDRLSQANY